MLSNNLFSPGCFCSFQVESLGMHEEWLGGSMHTYGGGYKINLLRNALELHKNDDKLIVLFTDRWVLIKKIYHFCIYVFGTTIFMRIKTYFNGLLSYDVVFTTNIEVIVHKFKKIGARILFGAEKYLWPDDTVEHLYPVVTKHLPKYLNSGLFMGKHSMGVSIKFF